MNTIKHLSFLRDMSSRLRDLASIRGNPENIVKRYNSEAEAVSWAYDKLLKECLVHSLLLYSEKPLDFNILSSMKMEESASGVVYSELACDLIFLEKILDFTRENGHGVQVVKNTLPDFLLCDKVFHLNDHNAMLISCYLQKDWLTGIGWKQARVMLIPWIEGLFHSRSWEPL